MRYFYDSGGFQRFKQAQRTYFRSSLARRLNFHFSFWGLLHFGVLLK